MPNYRRHRVPGGTCFFTVNLRDRSADVLVTNIDALRHAIGDARVRASFHIEVWVVLPEHMHCIWTLPEGDEDFPGRWRAIKTAFAKSLPATEHRSATRPRRHERGIWQRRFWEHTIRDDADDARHMDYVHFNPVRHGLVDHVADWRFSTFHRCVARGLYPAEWSAGETGPMAAGERR
jgi:putative transposase